MNKWMEATLGDVLTLQRGFDLPERMREDGTVPIVSSSGVSGFHSSFKVKAPGVVTGRYGTLGEVFYITQDFWPLNTTLWVKDFKGNLPQFISYLLQTLDFARQNAAGAVPGVNRNALHMLPVRTPPVAIQGRIAAILSAYDDSIENNTRRIKIVEEMAQMLYREWFVNFRFPGHQKVKMVESKLGPIPEGWVISSRDRLMDFQGGAQPPKSEWITDPRIGYVRMIQIRDYETDAHLGFVKDSRTLKKCHETDIMIARYGASVGRICWGLEGAYNVALVRVIPHQNHYNEFLRSYLSSDTLQRLLIGMSGRTAQAGFNKAILGAIRLPFPLNATLFEQYESISRPMREMILRLRDKNRNLCTTRDFLLPKLISGEIPVEAVAELVEQSV